MSKYNARKVTIDNIEFDSRAEANYYNRLKLLLKAGEVTFIGLQPKFLLQESYKRGKRKVREITYVADFHVKYANGKEEIIDVKGVKTEVYRLKKKMFEYRYPDLEIVEVSA